VLDAPCLRLGGRRATGLKFVARGFPQPGRSHQLRVIPLTIATRMKLTTLGREGTHRRENGRQVRTSSMSRVLGPPRWPLRLAVRHVRRAGSTRSSGRRTRPTRHRPQPAVRVISEAGVGTLNGNEEFTSARSGAEYQLRTKGRGARGASRGAGAAAGRGARARGFRASRARAGRGPRPRVRAAGQQSGFGPPPRAVLAASDPPTPNARRCRSARLWPGCGPPRARSSSRLGAPSRSSRSVSRA
jgi:hypothetical protein